MSPNVVCTLSTLCGGDLAVPLCYSINPPATKAAIAVFPAVAIDLARIPSIDEVGKSELRNETQTKAIAKWIARRGVRRQYKL